MKIAELQPYELIALNPDDDRFEADLKESKVHLEKAIPFVTGQTTIEDVEKKIRNRQCIVFNAWDDQRMVASVLVTVYKRQAGLACNVEMTGGSEEHYKDFRQEFLRSIEKYMKKNHGITYARIIGRPAWWRIAKDWGYTPTHFFAEKQL